MRARDSAMPVLQFKGKTAVECYHYTVPHHTIEFDRKLSVLGMLMDEILGEENFIANVVWQKRTSPDMRLALSDAHEYIVVYAKDARRLSLNKIPKSAEQIAQFKNPDSDPRGPWVSSDYTAQGFRPNQMYKITTPGGSVYEPPPSTCWKNVESGFLQL